MFLFCLVIPTACISNNSSSSNNDRSLRGCACIVIFDSYKYAKEKERKGSDFALLNMMTPCRWSETTCEEGAIVAMMGWNGDSLPNFPEIVISYSFFAMRPSIHTAPATRFLPACLPSYLSCLPLLLYLCFFWNYDHRIDRAVSVSAGLLDAGTTSCSFWVSIEHWPSDKAEEEAGSEVKCISFFLSFSACSSHLWA